MIDELANVTDTLKRFLEISTGNWRGDCVILRSKLSEYIEIKKSERSSFLLYSKLRKKNSSKKMILEKDIIYAEQAHKSGNSVGYIDMLGFYTIATPLIIDGILHSDITIIWGRVISEGSDVDAIFEAVKLTENKYHFQRDDLVNLAKKIPRLDQEYLGRFEEDFFFICNHLANSFKNEFGIKSLEAKVTERERLLSAQESFLLEANNLLLASTRDLGQITNQMLQGNSVPWHLLWQNISATLNQLVTLLGASFAVLFIPPRGNRLHIVQSSGKIPIEYLNSKYHIPDKIVDHIKKSSECLTLDYKADISPFVSASIRQYNRAIETKLNNVILASVIGSTDRVGFLSVFFEKANDFQVSEATKDSIIQNLCAIISSQLYIWNSREIQQEKDKGQEKLFEKFTHQLLSPLQTLMGHSDIIEAKIEKWDKENSDLFKGWKREDVDWLRNRLGDISATIRFFANIANNMAWIAYRSDKRKGLEPEIIPNLPKLIIDIARTYQAMAKTRGNSIHVDDISLHLLDKNLSVDKSAFEQVVGNIIHNAIKYSDRKTQINVEGQINGGYGYISIINFGICLDIDEYESIFEDGYRSISARSKDATGTGAGLGIAREIIELHNGSLEAMPSEKITRGYEITYRTTFTIKLPLYKGK